MRRLLIITAMLLALVAAGFAAVLMTIPALAASGPPPRPASVTKITLPPYPACTRAFGQCQVTEYRLHTHDGIQIWTCFAQPPVKPGASNVWVALDDCFQP